MKTMNLVISICGIIGGLGTAGAVIWKVIRPALHLVGRVDKMERKLQSDYNAIQTITTLNHSQNLALIAMINHMIDGNSIEALKRTRDQMQRDLLSHEVKG